MSENQSSWETSRSWPVQISPEASLTRNHSWTVGKSLPVQTCPYQFWPESISDKKPVIFSLNQSRNQTWPVQKPVGTTSHFWPKTISNQKPVLTRNQSRSVQITTKSSPDLPKSVQKQSPDQSRLVQKQVLTLAACTNTHHSQHIPELQGYQSNQLTHRWDDGGWNGNSFVYSSWFKEVTANRLIYKRNQAYDRAEVIPVILHT